MQPKITSLHIDLMLIARLQRVIRDTLSDLRLAHIDHPALDELAAQVEMVRLLTSPDRLNVTAETWEQLDVLMAELLTKARADVRAGKDAR